MVRRVISLIILAVVWACPAVASEFGTKAEAVAMVKRVQEKFKVDGADATFKAVMDKANVEFHDRDLYAFICDMNGVVVATGGRPVLVGKNLGSIKDQDGKYVVREMIEIAKSQGNGWIDYKWPNPLSSKIEGKSSYIERMGDFVVGVGVWKR